MPEWQREILLRRHARSRASVHRSSFPENDVLKDAGRSIALEPMRGRKVIVGMTTTPGRIEYIEPTILALLNQTQPVTIVLNVPGEYNDRRNHWKKKKIELPEWLKKCERIVIHRGLDYGPATKLIGTAVAIRAGLVSADTSTIVVASDDDHEWEPFALATLLAHAVQKDAKGVWTYFSYPYPRERQNTASKICVAQAGDLLAVPAAFLSSLEKWGNELLSPNGRLPSCFFVDDLFFAAYFKHNFDARVYAHPWRFWLFREIKKRRQTVTPCRGACSPVTIRFRYPDALAMGKPRDNHNSNCHAELLALGWWPEEDEEERAFITTGESSSSSSRGEVSRERMNICLSG